MTLVEVLGALAIAGILLAALNGVVSGALRAQTAVSQQNDLARQAHFAMERMTWALRGTRRLLLPFPDDPGTSWREHVREQTVPASPPEAGSSMATAVLAVTLPTDVDQDGNGIPDADNDGDGRVDEDLPTDTNGDGAAGIYQIDDDGDGTIDVGAVPDDDESSASGEDPINGLDDDGDGSVDEDPTGDINGDGQPGIALVDDDGDGSIDESSLNDDDEDGTASEDWFDPVVFFLAGDTLLMRTPVPWDTSGGSDIDGLDFVESPLAEGVTRFRVERVPDAGTRAVLVDLTLELAGTGGEAIQLHTRVRVGGSS
jgi:type II secretory pathway pseudopilin PulG